MQVSTVGLDIAKNVFQVHGVDKEGKVVITRQLRRGQVIVFFEKLAPRLHPADTTATTLVGFLANNFVTAGSAANPKRPV